jgi:hypothetical protein
VGQNQPDIQDGALTVPADIPLGETEIFRDDLDPFTDIVADEA